MLTAIIIYIISGKLDIQNFQAVLLTAKFLMFLETFNYQFTVEKTPSDSDFMIKLQRNNVQKSTENI